MPVLIVSGHSDMTDAFSFGICLFVVKEWWESSFPSCRIVFNYRERWCFIHDPEKWLWLMKMNFCLSWFIHRCNACLFKDHLEKHVIHSFYSEIPILRRQAKRSIFSPRIFASPLLSLKRLLSRERLCRSLMRQSTVSACRASDEWSSRAIFSTRFLLQNKINAIFSVDSRSLEIDLGTCSTKHSRKVNSRNA